MKSDLTFFSTDGRGLTSTSANHVANMAKEYVRSIEMDLDSLSFVSTNVSIIGSDITNQLTYGSNQNDLLEVIPKLRKIAKANSLIAWLREAIKAKEHLNDEVRRMTLQQFCQMNNYDYPVYPTMDISMTEDDFYSKLSVEERFRYYEAEALAAVLGKAVHPGGSLADAREQLIEAMKSPSVIQGEGHDALIYSYSPNVESEEVDIVFFNIQKLFREAQAKVNAVKHECSEAVANSDLEVKVKYGDEMELYNREIDKYTALMNAYKAKRKIELDNLKIRIPEALEEIYSEVNRLGKA